MNRRNFVRLAVAAALAPVALVREQPVVADIQVSTYGWWGKGYQYSGKWLSQEETLEMMNQLWARVAREPKPDLIVWRNA